MSGNEAPVKKTITHKFVSENGATFVFRDVPALVFEGEGLREWRLEAASARVTNNYIRSKLDEFGRSDVHEVTFEEARESLEARAKCLAALEARVRTLAAEHHAVETGFRDWAGTGEVYVVPKPELLEAVNLLELVERASGVVFTREVSAREGVGR